MTLSRSSTPVGAAREGRFRLKAFPRMPVVEVAWRFAEETVRK
jgi:hypothetical protein